MHTVCVLIFPSFRISLNNSSECPAGYTGPDCKYSCRYPSYGMDCFMKCDCSNVTCDFVSGCKVASATGKSIRYIFAFLYYD